MSEESNVKPFKKASDIPGRPAEGWKPTHIQNDIINHIADLYRRGQLDATYPDLFPHYRTMRMRDEDIETIYRINSKKEVKVVTQRVFDLLMTEFYRKLFAVRYEGNPMSVATQHATTSVLMQYIRQIEFDDVEIFAWPHEDILCWKKLDFKLISSKSLVGARAAQALDDDEPPRLAPPESFEWILAELKAWCPSWHSIISRCDNAKAFMAWIGTLFVRKSRNPQFVYMYGDGGDSKGTILQTLQKILGPDLYHTENLPEKRSGAMRFFSGSLEGKLLLMCPDNGQMDVFTPFMKSLTGGDPLAVEKKQKQTRNAVNHVRVLILSNDRPVVPNKPYARRRIILVPVRPYEGRQVAGYEEILYEERIEFLSLCAMAYEQMPNKMEIDQDMDVYKENAATLDEDLHQAIDKYFLVKPIKSDVEVNHSDKNKYDHMRVADFNDYVREKMPKYTPKKVKEALVDHYGLTKFHTSMVLNPANAPATRCVVGVKPKYSMLRGEGVSALNEGDEGHTKTKT